MEAYINGLIELYLTRGGSVFVSPQFEVAWDKEASEGGSCPDFVALDYDRRRVVIVEVTTASNIAGFFGKINQREKNWYRPTIRHLTKIGAINTEWRPRFLGIVREPNLAKAQKRYAEQPDVTFYPLERVLLEYAYFDDRQKGLPDGLATQKP